MNSDSVEAFAAYLGDDHVRAALRRALLRSGGTYAEFVAQLYGDIDEAIYALQATAQHRQHDGEDRITEDLRIQLARQGYDATHDTSSGGHVDLTIRLGTHSWIGEAKKDSNFWEGLLQLLTRYKPASGNYSHDHGGMLLYLVNSSDAAAVLDKWRERIEEDGASHGPCSRNQLAFFSTHKLVGSGTPFTVRSMAVVLHHAPADKSARASAKRTAAKARPGGKAAVKPQADETPPRKD